MLNNLINQAFGFAKKNVPDAENMFSAAMEEIKGNATPNNFLNALLGIAKSKGGYDGVVNHKYYPLLENVCKQNADNVPKYAYSTAKELGFLPTILQFFGNNKSQSN